MAENKQIKRALISVFHKEGLDEIVKRLDQLGVEILSTGGTEAYIKDLGVSVTSVESVTDYPSILGGRVKTLHPKVFGGILARRENDGDIAQLDEYKIPAIDLIIVDLYPFEDTVKSAAEEQAIIEKIDIGGISLIRAAAKNFRDTLIVATKNDYAPLLNILNDGVGVTSLAQRKLFARNAFAVSSHYDTAIFNWFSNEADEPRFRQSFDENRTLRYGENPHQKGVFHGNLDEAFEQLHGKALSYNNLVDIDAAVHLIDEFESSVPTFAILKHMNSCGLASDSNLTEAWKKALAGDPTSAFGGIVVTNQNMDAATAEEIHKIFIEVVIAPSYDQQALEILQGKKNRIILVRQSIAYSTKQFKTLLNGVIEQDKDAQMELPETWTQGSEKAPTATEKADLLFALKAVKHLKSNTISLVKNGQLIGSGTGQTSRVDALKQAIEKAKGFGFDVNGSVMASDAFFPFADCVEIANKAGINAVVQPGGSIRDKDSIDYCNANNMVMMLTGVRHFKH